MTQPKAESCKSFSPLGLWTLYTLEYVYMRPEMNSDRFEISNHFEKSFRLHGDFTAAAYKW